MSPRSDNGKRRAFKRARDKLQAAGVLLVEGDFYALTGEYARPDDTAFPPVKLL